MNNEQNKTEIIVVENENRSSRLAKIKELFLNRFTIPIFQRPYAWDDNNFRDLLVTIKENKKEGRDALFWFNYWSG